MQVDSKDVQKLFGNWSSYSLIEKAFQRKCLTMLSSDRIMQVKQGSFRNNFFLNKWKSVKAEEAIIL